MMVIPVCVNCQSPVNVVSDPRDGVEIINYHCPTCKHTAASFLLGYSEPIDREAGPSSAPGERSIQRAKLFGADKRHYKLRAKMQGLKKLRASTEDRDIPQQPSQDPADA